MRFNFRVRGLFFIKTFMLLVTVGGSIAKSNLSCYQCVRQADVECAEQELRSCPPKSDVCVVHASKDDQNGFTLKRECGVSPCSFNDDVLNRRFRWNNANCDRSKSEYFCVACCSESGCNKYSNSSKNSLRLFLLIVTIMIICEYIIQGASNTLSAARI